MDQSDGHLDGGPAESHAASPDGSPAGSPHVPFETGPAWFDQTRFGEPPPSVRWTPLHWLGMALFMLPFATIAIVMLAAFTGGSPALVPAVPLAFLGALVGFVLLVVATVRAKARRAVSSGARTAPSGVRRGMRGDHPGAPSIDFPDPPKSGAATGGALNSAGPDASAVRCQHCGVWSEPLLERGVRVCARCGAALPNA